MYSRTLGNTTAHNFPSAEAADKALRARAFVTSDKTCESQPDLSDLLYCTVVEGERGYQLERRV